MGNRGRQWQIEGESGRQKETQVVRLGLRETDGDRRKQRKTEGRGDKVRQWETEGDSGRQKET